MAGDTVLEMEELSQPGFLGFSGSIAQIRNSVGQV
jgi:hypothetical protein